MKCKDMEKIILADYIDGKVEGHELEAVESHLEACAACRGLAENAGRLGKIFGSVGRESPPAGLWHKIRAQIDEGPGLAERTRNIFERPRRFFRFVRPLTALAAAAAIALFLAAALRFWPVTASRPVVPQEEIIAETSYNGETTDADYDFGTSVEEYFL